MNKTIRDQIIFALEDDNELMTAALDGDLDKENKQMNRELIQRHREILAKLDRGEFGYRLGQWRLHIEVPSLG